MYGVVEIITGRERPLRVRRDASMQNTAPIEPEHTDATGFRKPGRSTRLDPERPRSSSITTTEANPINTANETLERDHAVAEWWTRRPFQRRGVRARRLIAADAAWRNRRARHWLTSLPR
jgi:hypothetical protein